MQKTFVGVPLVAVIAAVVALGVVGWNKGEALTTQMATMSDQLKSLNESQQKLVEMQAAAAEATIAIHGKLYVGSPDRPAKDYQLVVFAADRPVSFIPLPNGKFAVTQHAEASEAKRDVVIRDLHTDSEGRFRSGLLPPGTYKIAFLATDREGRPRDSMIFRTTPYWLYESGPPVEVELDVAKVNSEVRVRYVPPLPDAPRLVTPVDLPEGVSAEHVHPLWLFQTRLTMVGDGLRNPFSGPGQDIETPEGSYNQASEATYMAAIGDQAESFSGPLDVVSGRYDVSLLVGGGFFNDATEDGTSQLNPLDPLSRTITWLKVARHLQLSTLLSDKGFRNLRLLGGAAPSIGTFEVAAGQTVEVEIHWPGLPEPLDQDAMVAISNWTADDFEVVVTPVGP